MTRYTHTDVTVGDVVKSDINVQLELIETAIADTLSRKGDVPNVMEADFDMNSNDVLNIATLSAANITLAGAPISATVGTIDVTANYDWTGLHTWTTNPVDLTDDYAWTGTHTFAIKLLPAALNLTSTYAWTGTHTFSTRPTFNSNVPFDEGNIKEALVDIRTEAGTSDTLILTDRGSAVHYTSGSAVVATVPPNSSVPYPVGTVLAIAQIGAGQVTITAGGGVTLNTEVGLKTKAQYSSAALLKTATDVWLVTGSLSA